MNDLQDDVEIIEDSQVKIPTSFRMDKDGNLIYPKTKIKIFKSDNPDVSMEAEVNRFIENKTVVDIKPNVIDKKKYVVMVCYLDNDIKKGCN